MNATDLHQAHRDFLALAEAGAFGPPPPGEWSAEQLLAHVAATDQSIAAVALAIASGQRPGYDNRPSLDRWNLGRIVTAAGGLTGLTDLVRRTGELFCTVAEQLSEDDLNTQLPILIVSNDQIVVDEPRPLRFLVEGVGLVHLPRHGQQLHSLRATPPAG